MAAKRVAFALCTLGFLQTSFAGFERFWVFSKDANSQVNDTWDTMSDTEQQELIKRYQNLKEIPQEQRVALQQRMDWFSQLPKDQQQRMREAWQNMSATERAHWKDQLKNASAEQREQMREQILEKFD